MMKALLYPLLDVEAGFHISPIYAHPLTMVMRTLRVLEAEDITRIARDEHRPVVMLSS